MFLAPVNRFMKPTTKPVLPASAKPSVTSDMQGKWSLHQC